MSHLQYHSYPGVGQQMLENHRYNQTVRVGDVIYISGQGGWNRDTGVVHRDINAQIDQAFENVDFVLKDGGGKGWGQVFRVMSYHVPLNNEAMEVMQRNFDKWMPDHKALWTCVGVQRLGLDDMRVEIEVQAHVEK